MATREPAIGEHAVLSDSRATALVTIDGTIDWWALPEDPGIAVCDHLVDPARGGRFLLRPAVDAQVSRRYLSSSMVLETTFTTEHGRLVVTDCMTLHNGATLPWVELARQVHCQRGTVPLQWSFEPSSLLAHGRHGFDEDRGRLRSTVGDLSLGLLPWDAGDPVRTDEGVHGERMMVAGDDALLAVVAVVGDVPLPHPDRDEVRARVGRTVDTWRSWSQGVRYDGRWRDQVHTSARILKSLAHPEGAIVAAPTTSLPERVGGDLNWDYRYCWTRDASFSIDALLRVNLVEEAHSAIVALLRMARSTSPRLGPFYRVDGDLPERTTKLDVPGYRGSTPVRSGNSAVGQLQLGGWGDLLEALWIYVRQGNSLDAGTAELLTALVDELCELWRRPDSGIWELGDEQHYTISKMASWVAFDRALRMVDAGQISGEVDRWRRERDAVSRFIAEECWSDRRGSYTFYAGTEDLDAACLLAARTGFASGDSPEMRGTIRAVREELADGPFVWRYSGQQEVEGAFLACSFWLAEALVRAGELEDAARQLDGAATAMNDLGLMSEQYDPTTGEQLGNFPQGLSHLALVNAASFYTEALESERDAGT